MNISVFANNQVTSNNILEDAKLDWDVYKTPGVYGTYGSGTTAYTEDRSLTVRTDNGAVLGVVGKDYQVVQNSELVYIAEMVTGMHNLRVSSGGVLRGGSRVWLSIEAPSFEVGSLRDVVTPYLLISNGHDGLHSLGATPTSVRVWCQNTLNMAIEEGKAKGSYISLRHKGDMNSKIQGMIDILGRFYARTSEMNDVANRLSHISLDQQDLSDYFDTIYNKVVSDYSAKDSLKTTERKNNRKVATMQKWYNVFDAESDAFSSTSLWIAMNAITNWYDHGTKYRGDNKTENRFISNIYGSSAEAKAKVLRETLAFA